MIDNNMNFWGEDDAIEHELAPGLMSRRLRLDHKQNVHLGLLRIGRNVCFKKDDAPAPAPDPAIGQAAMANAEIGKEWLAQAKTQFEKGELRQDEYDKLIKQVTDSQLAQQGIQNEYQQKMLGYQDRMMPLAEESQKSANASAAQQLELQKYMFEQGKEQDAYNKSTFRPVEGKMVDEAMKYDSPERQEAMAGEAKADVMDAATRAQQASQRSMASMGVNPLSGRFAGVTRATDTQTALAAAGAQNKARNDVRQMGIMLRKDAANFGRGMSSTAAQSYGIGMQAGASGAAGANGLASMAMQAGQAGIGAGQSGAALGSSAVANYGAGQNSFIANNGIMNTGFTGAMQGYANQGNILNNLYGNQLNAWGMQQQANGQSSAGMGSMIGTLGGAAISAY